MKAEDLCEICYTELVYAYHICDDDCCRNRVCLYCSYECDGCHMVLCEDCYDAAKKEGGGINANNTGLNWCYTCTESGKMKEELENENLQRHNPGKS